MGYRVTGRSIDNVRTKQTSFKATIQNVIGRWNYEVKKTRQIVGYHILSCFLPT